MYFFTFFPCFLSYRCKYSIQYSFPNWMHVLRFKWWFKFRYQVLFYFGGQREMGKSLRIHFNSILIIYIPSCSAELYTEDSDSKSNIKVIPWHRFSINLLTSGRRRERLQPLTRNIATLFCGVNEAYMFKWVGIYAYLLVTRWISEVVFSGIIRKTMLTGHEYYRRASPETRKIFAVSFSLSQMTCVMTHQ